MTRFQVREWFEGLKGLLQLEFYEFFSLLIQTVFKQFKQVRNFRAISLPFQLSIILLLIGFPGKSQIQQTGAKTSSASLQNLSNIKWEWAKSEWSKLEANALDMAIDAMDNIYLTGYFGEEMEFGENTIQSVGRYDIFVAKYNANGNPIWIKNFGSSNESYGSSIVLGNECLYVSGMDGGTGMTTTIKLNLNGELKWKRYVGAGFHWEEKRKTLLYQNDQLFVASKDSLFSFNPSGARLAHRKVNIRCISAYSNGKILLATDDQIEIVEELLNPTKTFSLPGDETWINALAYHDGRIYLTGMYNGSISFNKDPQDEQFNLSGYNNIFVAKMDTIGTFDWVNWAGGDSWDMGNDLVVTDLNEVYVAGYYRNEAVFDTTIVGRLGLFDEIFVAKYDLAGGKLIDLITGSGSFDNDRAFCIEQGASKYLYVGGSLHPNSSINFGDFNLSLRSSGNIDFFVAKVKGAEIKSSISGNVFMGESPTYSKVKVYRHDPDSATHLIYEYQTASDGSFDVNLTTKGNYYLKAEYNVNDYVSSYYENSFHWELAQPIIINSDTTIADLKLTLIKLPVLDGMDKIAGKVIDTLEHPEAFIDLFLCTNDMVPLAHTLTDTTGNYQFNNVPEGKFNVLLNKTGIYLQNYYAIENKGSSSRTSNLRVTSPIFDNRDFQIIGYKAFAINAAEVPSIVYDTIDISSCHEYTSPSDKFTWHETGFYSDTISSSLGEDSIITTVQLTILQSHEITVEIALCNGDSLLIDGVYIKEEGIYYEHFKTNFGCDSIRSTHINLIDCVTNLPAPPSFSCTPYPNPTNGHFNISFGETFEIVWVVIRNQLGHVVHERLYNDVDIVETKIDVPAGLYYINVTCDTQLPHTLKIVKSR